MKGALFSVNDVVMAADKGKMYEAKVLKAIESGSGWQYFIHYNGWARRYDNWINELFISYPDDHKRMDSIRETKNTSTAGKDSVKESKSKKAKINESLVGEEIKDSSDMQSPSGSATTDGAPLKKQRFSMDPTNSANSAADRKEKRQLAEAELTVENDGSYDGKIPLHGSLKKHLVDDWTLITKVPQRLVSLPKPAHATVSSIITEFVASKTMKKEDPGSDDADSYFVQELMQGMALFFNRSLPILLLYRQERQQLQLLQETHPSMDFCDMYGAEHLLRLYVRLPRLLNNVQCSSLDKILSTIIAFLKFLQKNSSRFLSLQQYVLAEEELQRLVSPVSSSSLPAMEVDPTISAVTTTDESLISSEQVEESSAVIDSAVIPDTDVATNTNTTTSDEVEQVEEKEEANEEEEMDVQHGDDQVVNAKKRGRPKKHSSE